MSHIALNCLVSGDDADKIFTVQIASNDDVSILKHQIKHVNPNRFANTDVPAIQLFKVSLAIANAEQARDPRKIEGAEQLSPNAKISQVFQRPLERHIHVVVLPPPAEHKRAASPSLLQHELLKRTKLANSPPSMSGEHYQSIQSNPSQKILDDRPTPDVDVAPIALLYHGFGHFDDIMTGREAIDIEKWRPSVDAFAEAMSRFYDTEEEMQYTALAHLNSIFSGRLGVTIPSLRQAAIGDVMSGGHSCGRHGQPLNVVEIRNDLTGLSADPYVQAVAYITLIHARILVPELLDHWRMPCLAMSIVEHEVRFYAVVLLGHQYRVVKLTPALSCLPYASSGGERKALYAAFAAAHTLQAHMLADIEHHLSHMPPPIPRMAYTCPAVSKLRKHGAPGYTEFQIIGCHPSRQDYREVYVARENSNPETLILVKFSRTYCIDLHAFCFSKGHAPKILGFEYLPGGWYGIAMEYLQDAVALENAQFETQLVELTEEFHGKGLVHGDLRNTNILCAGQRFWLIKFDWGGKDGEVEYPAYNLNPELRDGRTTRDLRIRREDDIRILRNTLERLKS